MNNSNNILGLYRFNVETFESNTNNEYQPLVFVEHDDNRNQILLRNSNLTFNPRSNKNILQIENSGTARMTLKESSAGTDMKNVDIVNNNGSFQVQNQNDARSGSAVILQLNRKTNSQECDEIFLNCSDFVKIRDFAGPTTKFLFTMSSGDLTCTSISANVNATTLDTTNIEVTNIKAKDGTACASIADSTGIITLNSSVLTTTDINGGTIDGCDITVGPGKDFKIENSGTTSFTLLNTSVGTDMKNIDVVNNNGSFIVKNLNDARSGSAVILQLNRKTNSQECDEIFLNCSDFVKIRDFAGPTNKFLFTISSGDLTCTSVSANINSTTVDTTNLEVTNLKAKDGTSCGSIADSTGIITLASSVLTTTDINGGTIDGTTIATSNITVGSSKTLDVSAGTLTLADNQISGNKVEGGTINDITITTLNAGTVRAPDGSSSINFTTAHFGGEFYTTTPEVTANSILFTRTATVNGRKMVFGSDLTFDSSTKILTIQDLAMNGKIDLNYTNNTNDSGIFYVDSSDTNFATYFAVAGTGTSFSGGNAVSFGNVSSAIRMRAFNASTRGFIFENSSEAGLLALTADTGDLTVAGDVNIGSGKKYKINGANLDTDDIGEGSTNKYSPFTESGTTITYSAGDVAVTGGRITFPYFQISGTSANFMGALGFNRDVATGAILNNSFRAYQLHNNDGKMLLQLFETNGTAISGDVLVVNNESIGIGITTPTAQLHIDAGATAVPSSGFIRVGSVDYTSQTNNIMLSLAPGVVNFDANGIVGGYFKQDSAGNVGIGNNSPSEKLQVNGTVKASAFDPPSDDRLKKNETTLGNIGLEVINKLVCEKYDKVKEIIYIPIHDETDYVDNNDNTGNPVDNSDEIKMKFAHKTQIDWNLDNYSDSHFMKECGFIAQKVEQIDELKDYVDIGNDNEPYTLDYNSIFTFAVKAIQELSAENTQLKNKISNLEEDILLIKNNLNL
jgi:hypothetical protein